MDPEEKKGKSLTFERRLGFQKSGTEAEKYPSLGFRKEEASGAEDRLLLSDRAAEHWSGFRKVGFIESPCYLAKGV